MRFFALSILVLVFVSACGGQTVEEYIVSGNSYAEKGDWNAAIIEYKNAVKQDPDNSEAREKLGDAYLNTLNFEPAIKEFSKALEGGSRIGLLKVKLGQAYRMGGRADQILEEITVQENYNEQAKADIHALRGFAWLAQNDLDKAEEELKIAQGIDPQRTQVRLNWATLERIRGNTEAQRQWLGPLLERNGGIADAWTEIGAIEHQARNLDLAEIAYTRSIEMRSNIHIDLVRRAMVRVNKGDLAGARSDIEIMLNAGARWPVVEHTLGVIAFQESNLEEAQSNFQSVLSRFPDFRPSQLFMAMVHLRNQKYQSAISLLEQYLENSPDELRPNLAIAEALARTGNTNEALEKLKRMNSLYPNNPNTLSMLSAGYQQLNEMEPALSYLEQAIENSAEPTSLRMRLGSLLLREAKQVERARQELRQVLEVDPANDQARRFYFLSYMTQKNYTEARKYARELQEQFPDNTQGINMEALSYFAEGDSETAIARLNSALEKFPGDQISLVSLARIHMQNRNLDEARVLYQELLKKNDANIQVLNQLSLIAIQQKKPEESIEWLKQAYDRNPDVLSPKLLLATKYLEYDDAKSANQVLAEVSENQKEDPSYQLIMAQTKLLLGEEQHAIVLLKRLVNDRPDATAAYFLLAKAYSKEKNLVKMRESLERTLELNNEHYGAHIAMARLDLIQGKKEEFAERVSMLEKMFPKNRNVELLAAKLDSDNADYEGAIERLSALLDEKPDEQIVTDLSINQWNSGDRQGAISRLELWVAENTNDSRASMMLAQYYLAENRYEAARTVYKNLDSNLPNQPLILNNLAWSTKDIAPADGVTYAKKALELSPDNPLILDTLGVLYLKLGKVEEALAILKNAVELAPDLIDVQLSYAEALAANNQKNKARDLLKGLLESEQSSSNKIRIERLLATL